MPVRVGISLLCIMTLAGLSACGTTSAPGAAPNDSAQGGLTAPIEIAAEGARFVVGPLPPSWRRIGAGQAHVAFTNLRHDQVIMVNVVYAPNRQANLTALRNHLLFDITSRNISEQETMEVDNREALWTVVEGRLDGARIKMALLVVRIDDWVYDLAYIAVPEKFDLNLEDFKAFIATFHHQRNYPLAE